MFQQLEILSTRSADVIVEYSEEIGLVFYGARPRVRRESGSWLMDARGIRRDELRSRAIQTGRGSLPLRPVVLGQAVSAI